MNSSSKHQIILICCLFCPRRFICSRVPAHLPGGGHENGPLLGATWQNTALEAHCRSAGVLSHHIELALTDKSRGACVRKGAREVTRSSLLSYQMLFAVLYNPLTRRLMDRTHLLHSLLPHTRAISTPLLPEGTDSLTIFHRHTQCCLCRPGNTL